MSGEYVLVLRRRALGFLEEAREARDPDLAVFFAEQAMQLYIKSVLYELFGERVRGHGLRELLGLLARLLEEAGYGREAEAVRSFVAKHRGLLIEAEEAYTLARYGEVGYSEADAARMTSLAESLIRMLEGVAKRVKMG
ncbi:HEPN domain-containing protein [Pyrolobus fumarii]|uniref:HEPN domain-containing protein n=1 Tax=Pyrolobus fumarii TaxID=54252 RepID=UPI00064E9222|nr:HEPN domain-containing protein [Pyrolobus fumarii]